MKEQDLRRALWNMTTSAAFPEERRQAVLERMQGQADGQPIRRRSPRGRLAAIAMVSLLLMAAVSAMAADGWGILSFMKRQGKETSADQLMDLYGTPYLHPDERQELDLVDAVINEALYEDGSLYLAVTLAPVNENALVVPIPDVAVKRADWGHVSLSDMDPRTFTLREAMQNDSYEDVTVLDYAKEHGFDQVVLVESYSVDMYSNQSTWLEDEFDGVQRAEYSLLADGTLQLVLEIGYQPNLTFADRRYETAGISVMSWAFDTADEGEFLYGYGAGTHASFIIQDDRERLRSIPEDAHDIVGYIGEVVYISIAPYDEENMTITIVLNLRDDDTEDTWMTGPAWVIMDEAGNRLCTVDATQFYGLRGVEHENGDRMDTTNGVFPAACMPEDGKLILRAENRNNRYIVYDEYTYTLIPNQETHMLLQ